MYPALDDLPQKKLQELELLTRQLMEAMRRTKLQSEPVFEELKQLEVQLTKLRQANFDAAHPTFTSFQGE